MAVYARPSLSPRVVHLDCSLELIRSLDYASTCTVFTFHFFTDREKIDATEQVEDLLATMGPAHLVESIFIGILIGTDCIAVNNFVDIMESCGLTQTVEGLTQENRTMLDYAWLVCYIF